MRWLRDWSPRKLVIAWVGYWLALVVVGLGPAVPAIWRATHADKGQGNISFGFGSGGFNLVVSVGGSEIWNGSISLLALALWIGVPPLVLWVAWLTQRPSIARSAVR
jgi:hypothetical protein